MAYSFPPAPYASLPDYVQGLGGRTVISTILIANNGLGALKAIRSMRKWCYETFEGKAKLKFVVMATSEDLAANSEFVRFADQYVEVPGGTNNHNYANVRLIIESALRAQAHAVWPGWGHASEFPDLPRSCREAGLVFMGPGAKAMHDLGDKIASTLIGQSSGVPCAPWSGSHVTVDYQSEGIPAEKFQAACVDDVQTAVRVIEETVGYPAMIKASEGGGGKGIRKVTCAQEIEPAFRAVQSEVPGSPIFIMKMLSNCRHLEVQIIADAHGNAISLYSRDCSIQRRHQKIFEEGPVLGVPQETLRHMERSAVRLAKSVGYEGAGTVEFIYGRDGSVYLLELNPRLQVEHPVTEGITRINLPATQLQIAMGIPLHRIPDIRAFYGLPRFSTDELDLDSATPLPPHGHVIACRITSENSQLGFKPTGGLVEELTFRGFPNVWAYFSVRGSCRIHEFADSQFGHIFSWGDDRETARKSLVACLNDLTVRGEIYTPVEFLLPTLELPDYRALSFHTSWLDELIANPEALRQHQQQGQELTGLHIAIMGAIVKTVQQNKRHANDFLSYIERGQIPPAGQLQPVFRFDVIYDDVKYALVVVFSGPKSLTILSAASADESAPVLRASSYTALPDQSESAGSSGSVMCSKVLQMIARATGIPLNDRNHISADFLELNDSGVFVLLDGRKHVCYGREEATGLRLTVDQRVYMLPKDDDPTALRTLSPGKLVHYLVADGSHVQNGTPFAEIEVMKMFMTLTSTQAGRITLLLPPGSTLNSGDVLARLELDDPSSVKSTTPFTSPLPVFAPPKPLPTQLNAQFQQACEDIKGVLSGYVRPDLQDVVFSMLSAASSPELAVLQFREVLSNLASRLPPTLVAAITDAVLAFEQSTSASLLHVGGLASFPRSPLVNRVLSGRDGDKADHDVDNADNSYQEQHHDIALHALVNSIDEQLNQHISSDARVATVAAPLSTLLSEYRGGFRERISRILDEYFKQYLATERYLAVFSRLSTSLSDLPATELSDIVAMVRSTSKVSRKADLIGHLLTFISRSPSLIAAHIDSLTELGQLNNAINIDLSIQARKLLIRTRLPSWSTRYNQVRTTLLAVLQANDAAAREELLQPLIGHTRPLIDVLTGVFVDPDDNISKFALEVYIRRCYRAYHMQTLPSPAPPSANSKLPFKRWDWLFSPIEEASASSSEAAAENDTAAPGTGHRRAPSIHRAESVDKALSELSRVSRSSQTSSSSQNDSLLRFGSIVLFSRLADFIEAFEELLSTLTPPQSGDHLGLNPNILTVVLSDESHVFATHAEESFCAEVTAFLSQQTDLLNSKGIRRITVVVSGWLVREYPLSFTFRDRLGFKEDPIYRNIEPPLAHNLELDRLNNFDIELLPNEDRQIHLYRGRDKVNNPLGQKDVRYFTRAIVRQPAIDQTRTSLSSAYAAASDVLNQVPDLNALREQIEPELDVLLSEIERVLLESIRALEIAVFSNSADRSNNHHIFLRIMSEILLEPAKISRIIQMFGERYGPRLWRLQVSELEVALRIRSESANGQQNYLPVRFVVLNPSGYNFNVYLYTEDRDPLTGDVRFFALENWGLAAGDLHMQRIDHPYPRLSRLQRKRFEAQAIKTAYIYDVPELFNTGLMEVWKEYSAQWRGRPASSLPPSLVKCTRVYPAFAEPRFVELILDGNGQLVETNRPPALNNIGMVAWRASFSTPEYPHGRNVIIIGNDITFQSGSFGPDEDLLFLRASEYARAHGLPRIYISANSGARIGLALEVQKLFRAKWKDNADPTKGFEYLYLADADYKTLNANPASPVVVAEYLDSEGHWRITDIIGEKNGLGVENLMGSGMIAGETSRAYSEIFTITLVTGRSVGIGAYLVRLGQRTVQNEGPIILTGALALNKVLGRDVYTSNVQLGGPQIMFNNGVSHIDVNDDQAGVLAILRWLSYVPAKRGMPLSQVPTPRDPIERSIAVWPTAAPYDPRTWLAGVQDAEQGWLGGFCDRDSFIETLGGWARTVVCGRGRLGGIPIGVIAVETRTIDRVIPADPANIDSQQIVMQQPGQVWFPNSAYKTAQAIKDFKTENLPLFVFANWRGFSGGMRDMFDEVLKYGAYIVDALCEYKQPVFVYLPPHGELRGGAWVVVDPNINAEMMEMYADRQSRGGVLEPSGTIEIKYRTRDIIQTIHRLDEQVAAWQAEQAALSSSSLPEYRALQRRIDDRVNKLIPIYQQLALKFADLHDTPGRMQAKKAIHRVLDWPSARFHLYCRMRRRLLEERIKEKIRVVDPQARPSELLSAWVHAGTAQASSSSSTEEVPPHVQDIQVGDWLSEESRVEAFLASVKSAAFARSVTNLITTDSQAFISVVLGQVSALSEQDRQRILAALQPQ